MMREYLILHMTALAVGTVLDILIGDPAWLFHPVRAIGALISFLEWIFRKDGGEGARGSGADNLKEMIFGTLLWIIVMIVTFGVSFVLLAIVYRINRYAGLAVEAFMTFQILAAGSLRDESMKVYKALKGAGTSDNSVFSDALENDRMEAARSSLSMIVGRDTAELDEPGIIRAAVETVAENTSDGVIAPLLYTFAGGPVLGMCYKAVNTMDSMLGYHNEKYEYFGKFAARADDVANFLPSRISALFMALAAWVVRPGKRSSDEEPLFGRVSGTFGIWRRDRHNHKSPNSAQTESACAGALGVRLGGDSYYNGILVKKPFIGDDTRDVETDDIKRAVRLMFATEALCTAVIYITTLSIMIIR